MSKERQNRPTGMTKRQLDLLILVFPGPIGEGLTIAGAARRLGITSEAAYHRLKHFKRRFPKAWQRVASARSLLRQDRLVFKKKEYITSLEKLEETENIQSVAEIIKERF